MSAKNGWLFTSSAFLPNRRSEPTHSFSIKSMPSSERFASGGMRKFVSQFITFWQKQKSCFHFFHSTPKKLYHVFLQTNLALSLRRGVCQERRRTHQHLVQNNADAPPVAQLRVARALQHLRCNVIGCAYERVRQATLMLAVSSPVQRLQLRTIALVVPIIRRVH